MSGNLSEFAFDANEVEPADLDVIPDGEYEMMIVDSYMQTTKAQNGKMLVLELQVIRGPYKGRKVWDRLNLDNPSQKAVEIARATLSAICRAVGVLQPKDSKELHERPLVVKIKIRRHPEYGDSNEVTAYKKSTIDAGMKEVQQAKRPAVEPQTVPQDEIPF